MVGLNKILYSPQVLCKELIVPKVYIHVKERLPIEIMAAVEDQRFNGIFVGLFTGLNNRLTSL
jgi:hypothetical protein